MSKSLGEKLTAATPILTIGLGLLALSLDVGWWWLVFALGWFVATPLVAVLFDTGRDAAVEEVVEEQVQRRVADAVGAGETGGPTDREDALDLLRERYAAGDIDEVEFERRVERLLETESVEDAAAMLERERE